MKRPQLPSTPQSGCTTTPKLSRWTPYDAAILLFQVNESKVMQVIGFSPWTPPWPAGPAQLTKCACFPDGKMRVFVSLASS